LLGIFCALPISIAAFTFVYGRGYSYMSDDPNVCANCHVMRDQLKGWQVGDHHHVATCNDCHTPKSFVGKYWTKALNGYHHSLAFTLGNFHEPIKIKPNNLAIAEASCQHCHESVEHSIMSEVDEDSGRNCTHCHRTTGHGY
jgi:cytochrome c nitrite reductase small subunit